MAAAFFVLRRLDAAFPQRYHKAMGDWLPALPHRLTGACHRPLHRNTREKMRTLPAWQRLLPTLAACAAPWSGALAEPIRIASLNPIVSDLARQVGGEQVEVIDLMPVGSNPHRFYPSPSHLKQASGSALVLAAGKGLEGYLDEFRESLGGHVPVFEAGSAVPALKVEADEVFIRCPAHAEESIDPHWWHSVRNAQRAAKAIARKLGEVDPEHARDYDRRGRDYIARLDTLHRWAGRQIAGIPRQDRELTTSHTAFGYLCRAYGLRSITVQGLSTEQNPAPGHLKDVIKTLRDHDVRVVFPEDNANPKVLAGMVRETGVAIGGALYAGTLPEKEPTYEGMIRHNITTIVDSLRRKE